MARKCPLGLQMDILQNPKAIAGLECAHESARTGWRIQQVQHPFQVVTRSITFAVRQYWRTEGREWCAIRARALGR
eukprot:IDg5846t1